MKKLLAILLAVMMLASCGGETVTEEPEKEPEEIPVSESSEAAEEPVSAPEEEPSEEPEPEIAEEPEEQEEPVSAPEEEKEPFDVSAVSVEETDDGIRVTYEALPGTADDMKALVDKYGIDDPLRVTAFFIAAVSRYNESPEDAFAMIDVLRGPQPMSDHDKSFMEERFSDKLYLADAYFDGAEPGNDYITEAPYAVTVYSVSVAPPEGYAYAEVITAGADSPRRISLRIKDGNCYIWEYNGILLSIRLPKSEDPWA